MMKRGKVTLVRAGPGDPELITVRGMKALQNADVILYDALSSEELLAYAPASCENVYVGKRCGRHSLKQSDINALIIQYALQGKLVVRLKGGDPFVFGRGHEEMVSLQKLNIEVDVIPGISSVTSLPLLQGVPLTRRNVAESFWVMTGTTLDHHLSEDIYQAAKSNGTAVILMGMNKLEEIAAIYETEGRSNLPVMVISKGSTEQEKIAIGTVADIVKKVKDHDLPTPGIIVLGDVVALHPQYVQQKVVESWA